MIRNDSIRDNYIERLAMQTRNTDWRTFAYALMSNHGHLLAWPGRCSFQDFIHTIHSGFASYCTRRLGLVGPVFASRPKTIPFSPDQTLKLLSYVHNNPVRAGICGAAKESSWTSHAAYLDPEKRPTWLDVLLGFELCGYNDDEAGRASLNAFVEDKADDTLSDVELSPTEIRKSVGSMVELGSP